MDREKLIRLAMDARSRSYTPYSHYNVGAALLCDDGEIICGSNIENASYPATVCAERCAIFTAVASGRRNFTAIAVCGGADTESDVLSGYAYPCGICRQVMREFTDPDRFIVIVARSVNDYKEYTLSELLPNSFGPENL